MPDRPARTCLIAVMTAAVGCALAAAPPAMAAPNLITNGDFTSYTVGGAASTTSYIVAGGQTSGSSGATLTGWTNAAYAFVFQPGTASSTGAVISGSNTLKLWGPDGGTGSAAYSNNGFTSSPTGGAFLASDGAYQQGRISQTISGLTSGQTYQLSFLWAAAQQYGFDGDTTEGWTVYWSDANNNTVATASTATVNNVNHGFVPWMAQSFRFVATTTTMTLGFLATGGPNGTPPFSLLDGVTLVSVPEPGSLAVFGVGLMGLTMLGWRRRRTA